MQFRRPESVLVIVANDAREVLLLRRRNPPDYWQSVTGALEWGESAMAAARRELREETGLAGDPEATGLVNDFPIVPPWTARYAPQTRSNREHVYLLRVRGRPVIRIDPQEHLEYRWLTASDALRLATSSTNRDAIRRLTDG